jgi:hypothetical protein
LDQIVTLRELGGRAALTLQGVTGVRSGKQTTTIVVQQKAKAR